MYLGVYSMTTLSILPYIAIFAAAFLKRPFDKRGIALIVLMVLIFRSITPFYSTLSGPVISFSTLNAVSYSILGIIIFSLAITLIKHVITLESSNNLEPENKSVDALNPVTWVDRILAVLIGLSGAVCFFLFVASSDFGNNPIIIHLTLFAITIVAVILSFVPRLRAARFGFVAFGVLLLVGTAWSYLVFPKKIQARAAEIIDGRAYCIARDKQATRRLNKPLTESWKDLTFLTLRTPELKEFLSSDPTVIGWDWENWRVGGTLSSPENQYHWQHNWFKNDWDLSLFVLTGPWTNLDSPEAVSEGFLPLANIAPYSWSMTEMDFVQPDSPPSYASDESDGIIPFSISSFYTIPCIPRPDFMEHPGTGKFAESVLRPPFYAGSLRLRIPVDQIVEARDIKGVWALDVPTSEVSNQQIPKEVLRINFSAQEYSRVLPPLGFGEDGEEADVKSIPEGTVEFEYENSRYVVNGFRPADGVSRTGDPVPWMYHFDRYIGCPLTPSATNTCQSTIMLSDPPTSSDQVVYTATIDLPDSLINYRDEIEAGVRETLRNYIVED